MVQQRAKQHSCKYGSDDRRTGLKIFKHVQQSVNLCEMGWFYLPLYFSVCLKHFIANHSQAKEHGRKLISSSAL